ncbi:MAG TPA: FGGY family carbohydrate kinase [Chitinophagaceae bacterium]|nr:FGGY family carbohydrate kinase [Chitinophagaceae bacterium]
MTPVIAIFDIGKTNKKFFLIDEAYNIVLERSVPFDEIMDEDDDACDDVNLLTKWVIETLTEVLRIKKFDVKAVNFSAYGASFVYIDEKGKVIAPLYSYLKKYPEQLKNELYNKYGGAEKISCETASPVLGSLNSGMQLYRIKKEKPPLYSQMKYALHLPQYISYLITRRACSDITSIGCHTQLWDYQKSDYHQWAKGEEIDKKLATLLPSDKASDFFFSNKKLKAGTGLHDSSAALIPYLKVFTEPFILLSTGTWCISLNPFNRTHLTSAELKEDCLCYMEYQGKPVKASRLFAGYEHEQQVKKIAGYFNKPADFYKKIKYDASVIATLQKSYDFDQQNKKNEIEIKQSNFGNRELAAFKDYNQAYHCLILDIIRQQHHSTELVIHGSDVNRIFVDGGFSNNSIYMHLLALAFPQLEIYAASVAQATAMGAALAIHNEWNSLPLPADMVKLKYYKDAGTLNTII